MAVRTRWPTTGCLMNCWIAVIEHPPGPGPTLRLLSLMRAATTLSVTLIGVGRGSLVTHTSSIVNPSPGNIFSFILAA